ncbi:hypothetical protein [Desulforegula conservatrix]|uniref:hypothetical protein n=1 Tax=Desulforegula conservatrix TaxID=153026 RepID=UPI00040BF599|nr:hypothetical protein [Desulforegula conservatrix]
MNGVSGLSPAELEVVRTAMDMGGTIFIVILLVVCLAVLAWRFGGSAMKCMAEFIAAQQRQADAMTAQAASMSDIKNAVHEYITRDNSEHREILLGLQVLAREMRELTNELAGQRNSGPTD